MDFNEAVQMIKGSCSRQIFSSYGYDDTRKKYTALETSSHNNADLHPSMGLHQSGDSFFLKDFAGEQKKYSSIDLIMISEGLRFQDAVRRGAEICGISIYDNRGEEFAPDMKFVIKGLYDRAKRESFSVKEILSKYHYHYKNAEGNKLYDKYRIDYISGDGKREKHISQGVEKNGYVRKFKDKEYQSCIAMYGDFRQYKAGERVYIPEGEKCVDFGHRNGMKNVVTAGSSNDWKHKGKKFAPFFKDVDIVILQDNDIAGENLTRDIISSLNGVAASIKVVVPDKSRDKADIADFFSNGGTLQQLEKMIEGTPCINGSVTKQKAAARPAIPQEQQNKHLEQALRELHAEQYETSDKSFGRLFADVFKDKHRYNPSRKDFMRYDGKRWIDDIEGLSARASAKALSDALVRYAVNVDTEGKYLKAVAALCNIRNRNNMLQDSKDVYFFSNEQLDVKDYLLNLQNGTLDLSGNEPVFLNHNPDMLLSKICNVEYNPTADCREWKKFLLEIMQGDKEKTLYLQKIAGLSLTGNTEQETCFILFGSTTRNGKSTFCETLIYLLGDYALTMKPESLAVKQNLDSRQASGDIARLAGCRFCNASEPPKRMIFDTALLKSLLGRDSITARHLHQREFSFIPKFKLVINTNYLPTITDDTVFSSGRINVISFDRHFEPQEQDKDLKNRLRDKQELSGILNWCIEGLQLYRKEGLKPPAAVRTATDTYRTDSDKIGNFINECLTKTDKNSKAKDIYEVYAKWCEENGFGVENKSNFFAELKTKGLFANSGTVGGKTVKNIVKGYTVETEFIEYKGQEELPFD